MTDKIGGKDILEQLSDDDFNQIYNFNSELMKMGLTLFDLQALQRDADEHTLSVQNQKDIKQSAIKNENDETLTTSEETLKSDGTSDETQTPSSPGVVLCDLTSADIGPQRVSSRCLRRRGSESPTKTVDFTNGSMEQKADSRQNQTFQVDAKVRKRLDLTLEPKKIEASDTSMRARKEFKYEDLTNDSGSRQLLQSSPSSSRNSPLSFNSLPNNVSPDDFVDHPFYFSPKYRNQRQQQLKQQLQQLQLQQLQLLLLQQRQQQQQQLQLQQQQQLQQQLQLQQLNFFSGKMDSILHINGLLTSQLRTLVSKTSRFHPYLAPTPTPTPIPSLPTKTNTNLSTSYNLLHTIPGTPSLISTPSFTTITPSPHPLSTQTMSWTPQLPPTNLFPPELLPQRPKRVKKSEGACRSKKCDDDPSRFVCPCHGKTFANKFSLTRHLRLQKGYKNHICAICFKPHAEKSQLQRHLQHHLQSKPFVCPVPRCPKKYADKTNLERHRRTVHTSKDWH